nr:hypothetical protein [uncultured Nitrososphaera sp.]
MLSVTVSKKKYSMIIFIPIILSSFTHLWNATGFPDSLHPSASV